MNVLSENDDANDFVQYTIFMDAGKTSFTLEAGQGSLIAVNLTSSFDGIALPSKNVTTEGTFYEVEKDTEA